MWDYQYYNSKIGEIKQKRYFHGKYVKSKEDIYKIIANILNLSKDTVKSWTRPNSNGPKDILPLAGILGVDVKYLDPFIDNESKSFAQIATSIIFRCLQENKYNLSLDDDEKNHTLNIDLNNESSSDDMGNSFSVALTFENQEHKVDTKVLSFTIVDNLNDIESMNRKDCSKQMVFVVIPCRKYQPNRSAISLAKVRQALRNDFIGILVVDAYMKLRCVKCAAKTFRSCHIISRDIMLGDYFKPEEEII